MKIVLASTSKDKSDLLNKCFIKHTCIKSNYDEGGDKSNPYSYAINNSKGKLLSLKDKVNDSIVIGLDTICFVDGKVLEKPIDKNDAINNIKMCMNKETLVITGLSILNQKSDELFTTSVVSKVKIRNMSDKDIEFYINNEENYMYASGFIIETIISNFIEYIDGSFYNILGVPVEEIYKHINEWGYYLEDLEG